MYPDASVVAKANELLERAHGRISNEISPYFGGDMLFRDENFVVDNTIAVRFLKKFERPSQSNTKSKRAACFKEWVDIDEELGRIRPEFLSSSTRSHLYRARQLISEWCKDFKPSTDIEFTPGETFTPSRGKTSIIRKLLCASHWTVTYDAFDDFAKLVYNTSGLKRAARKLMKPLTAAESKVLLSLTGNPFEAFKSRLESVCTLTQGSRLSTVYKNKDEDRTINVETLGNMLLQRTVALPLRQILREIGNDLEIGQQLHARRISDPKDATVDFKKASDRVATRSVKFTFPSTITKLLDRYRSSIVYVGNVAYVPHKLSSMGCGFTFEVMTMFLLALARVLDPSATVYGDDVIIRNDVARQFIQTCDEVGMKVNLTKSFVDSPLRESCGSYYFDPYGYITCYDFKWCDSWADVCVAANKLREILADYRCPHGLLHQILTDAHKGLCSLANAMQKGPIGQSLDVGFIQVDDMNPIILEQKRDKQCKKLFNHVRNDLLSFCSDMNYDPHLLSVVKVQVFKPALGFQRSRKLRDQGPTYLASLYAGRLASDTIRGEGEFVWKLLVCHPHFGWRLAKHIVKPKPNA